MSSGRRGIAMISTPSSTSARASSMRGGAADGPLLHLAIVDLASFLGEARADVLGRLGENPCHLADEIAVARGRVIVQSGNVRKRARGDVRRHDRLADLAAIAFRAGELAGGNLGVVRSARGEPALELVSMRALQAVLDHDATSFGGVSAAYTTSNGRSCRRDGNLATNVIQPLQFNIGECDCRLNVRLRQDLAPG